MLRVLVVVGAAMLGSGCGVGTSPPSTAESAPAPTLVWPAAPSRARIRFVRTVARPVDLGIRRSWWQRLGDVIAGARDDVLVRPTAVVVSGSRMYIADPGRPAIWVIDQERGTFEKVEKASRDVLVSPVAVAAGPDGRVYVADSALAKVFVYRADLKLVQTISSAELRRPAGLAVDAARGRLYVADSASHRVWIAGPDGRLIGSIGQRGTGPGQFNFPTHLGLDTAGTLYVTDALGFRIEMFDAGGRFAGAFGQHGDSSGDFAAPKGVAVDSHGHVYVVESLFDAVQIFDRQGRFLLSVGERGIEPGKFWLPSGAFVDAHDRLYVADAYNHRIQVFDYVGGAADD